MTAVLKSFRWSLILLFALAAGSAAAQLQPGQLPINSQGLPLVAVVNQVEITLPDFQQALQRRQQEMLAADPSALQAEVLEQLIDQALIEQGAAALEIVVTDEELQAELLVNIELAGSPEAWNAWLAANGYQVDEFNATLRATLITNHLRDSLTADLAGDVPQARARHILLRTEQEAAAILSLLQGGGDFATLAQRYSLDDTTRAQGGDLGWFAQEELLVPELAAVAFQLLPGQIGGPVSTALGYHVIQTLETGRLPVDPERRVYIAQNRFENWLDQMRQGAVIERYL